jgi:hypothetical protein
MRMTVIDSFKYFFFFSNFLGMISYLGMSNASVNVHRLAQNVGDILILEKRLAHHAQVRKVCGELDMRPLGKDLADGRGVEQDAPAMRLVAELGRRPLRRGDSEASWKRTGNYKFTRGNK